MQQPENNSISERSSANNSCKNSSTSNHQRLGSNFSENQQIKKLKSKSFNRKQGNTQDEYNSLIKSYRQIQFSPQIRKFLKKITFYQMDKQKYQKLLISQAKETCEKELKRISNIKRTNKDVQRFLINEDIQQLDNQLSILSLNSQINHIIGIRSENQRLNASIVNMKDSSINSRQYENLLLQIQKNDELMKTFVQTNLNLSDLGDLNIEECKKFFKKQINQTNKSSDRVILSRKILFKIIIFFCRVLEGEIVPFNEVFESYSELITTQTQFDQNNNVKKITRKKQSRIKTLQQEQEEMADRYSSKSSFINKNDWNGISSHDIGLKVNQLANICQQIPQLQTFTRTLKFSKITLENRQSFFKIVDVIRALHRKIGYLSRSKPTLLREIQDIQFQLNSISASIHQFVSSLEEQMPSFAVLNFNKQDEENSKHQMTEILFSLRKDLRKMADIMSDQQKFQNQLYDKIGLFKTVVQTFWLNISENEDTWEQFFRKLSDQNLDQEENHILHQLNECMIIFEAQLKNPHKNEQSLETERKLETEVHTLLEEYERMKAENNELRQELSSFMEQRQQMQMDIEQRNKMILNLTNIKVSFQKRQTSLKDQLLNAQQDCRSFQQIINDLQNQIERLSIQNQNLHKQLIYEHQDQVKELIDKINQLQKTKIELVQKYQIECMKSIQNLHGFNNINLELKNFKQIIQKKTKQSDDAAKKYRQNLNDLEKQISQLKNSNQLLENQLQTSQKNKKRLIDKLDVISTKSQQNMKDTRLKFQSELSLLRDINFKLEKQLQKQKRNSKLLSDSVQHLKDELASNLTIINQYRLKYFSFSSLQNDHQILMKQHDKKIKSFQKLESVNQNNKNKLIEVSYQLQATEDQLISLKQQLKRQQRKNCELQQKLAQNLSSYQILDDENKNLQKMNKSNLKKIKDLETELQTLRGLIDSQDKNSNSLLNRSQIRFKQHQQQQQLQLNRLEQKIRQLHKIKDKNDKQIIELNRVSKNIQNQYQIKYDEWLRSKKQYERKINQRDCKILQLQQNVCRISKDLKQIKQLIQQKQEQLEQFEKDKNELKIIIGILQKSQQRLKTDLGKLEDQLSRLNDEVQKLKRKLNEKQRQFQQYKEFVDRKSSQKKIADEYKQKAQQILTAKQKQIHNLREHIIIQKTTLVNQNKQLYQQNGQLQDQIQKLKRLNDLLQRNVKKLQNTSSQTQNQMQNKIKDQLKQTQFTIIRLEGHINELNKQIQYLQKKNNELNSKLEQKYRFIIDKDNLIFEKELTNNGLEKVNKQLKFKIEQLESEVEILTVSMQKIKVNKIKLLQNQITALNVNILQSKKQEDLSKHHINNLQIEIEKLKKEYFKKYQAFKLEKIQLEDYYQTIINKNDTQHTQELINSEKRAKKQAENQNAQQLIKQKQNFNNFFIDKMEQLNQIKRKYQKILKQKQSQKDQIQFDYDNLLKKYNNLSKSHESLINDKQNQQSYLTEDEINKLKVQNQSIKKQNQKLSQELARILRQLSDFKQNNSRLIGKQIELQHQITLLTTKNTQISINLQSTIKSLSDLALIQRQKNEFERELEKFKNKNSFQQSKLNDMKKYILQLEGRLSEMDLKISNYRNKQYEWNSNQNEMYEKNKILQIQLNQIKDKINLIELDLQNGNQKLKQKQFDYQTILEEVNLKNKLINDKQKYLNEIQKNFLHFKADFDKQAQNWRGQEHIYKVDIENLLRKNKQLEFQVDTIKKSSFQSSKLSLQFAQISHKYQILDDKYHKLSNENDFHEKRFKYLQEQKLTLISQRDSILTSKSNLQIQLQRLKYENNELRSQLNGVNNQLKIIMFENDRINKQLIIKEKNLEKSGELKNQLNELKEFYDKQMKRTQNQVKRQFQTEKQAIIQEFEKVLKQLNSKLKKSQQNNLHLNENKIILQKKVSELQKMLQKLYRQNMQLSQHCKTYEQKILLLNKQKQSVNGNLSSSNNQLQLKIKALIDQKSNLLTLNNQLQSKLKASTDQKYRLQEAINKLQNSYLDLQNQTKDCLNQIGRLKSVIDETRRSIQRIGEQKGQIEIRLNIQIEQLLNRIRLMEQALNQLNNQKNKEKNNYQRIVNDLRIENQNLKRLITQLQDKNMNLKLALKKQDDLFLQEKTNLQNQLFQVTHQLQNSRRHIFQLQTIKSQLRSRQIKSKQQQTYQIERLRAESSIRGQQVLRLNELLKKKDSDFIVEIRKIVEEKNSSFKQNQNLKSIIYQLERKIAELQMVLITKQSQIQRLNIKFYDCQIIIKQKGQQINSLNNEIVERKRKQNDLLQNLSRAQSDLRNIQIDIEQYCNQIYSKNQQGQSFKINQKKLKEQNRQLNSQLIRLSNENQQLKQEINKLYIQIQNFNISISNLNVQIHKYCGQNERLLKQLSNKEIIIAHFHAQIERLNQELNSKQNNQHSQRSDFQKTYNQMMHLKNRLDLVERQNNEMRQIIFNLEKQNGQMKKFIGILEKQNHEIRHDNNRLAKQINESKHRNNLLQKQSNQIKISNNQLAKENNQNKNINEQLLKQINQLKNTINQLIKQNTQMKCSIQLLTKQNLNLKNTGLSNILSLERQNIELKKNLAQYQRQIMDLKKNIQSMNNEIQKGNQVMQSADRELKRLQEEKTQIHKNYYQLKISYEQLARKLKENEQQILKKSRNSSINLVTNSYIYQGGKITAEEFNKLHDEYLRLLKQVQSRNSLIENYKAEVSSYLLEIRTLKQQIQLLSEGKTINIKGYTRITNPNDTVFIGRGLLYTEYDVKEIKAKIQILEKSVKRYQDREAELLKEIEKLKFRQKSYIDQIRTAQQNGNKTTAVVVKNQQPQNVLKITSLNEAKSFNIPESSTYKLQVGIQQFQNHRNNHQIVRIQTQQLSQTIQRISNSNQIMTFKIDEILYNSMKLVNNDILLKILSSNEYNLPVSFVNQIRQSIHQNKALVETLKTLKQNREDIDMLLHEYIDPEMVTEFVYRILTYFSEVENESPDARNIREELNRIRKNNVSGYYFTILEEYTKYILENNSIQLYKEELRQKARDLSQVRDKLHVFIDSKLSQKDRFLDKSSSKGSIITKSRGKYLSNSRQQGIDVLNPSLVTVNTQAEKLKGSSILSYTPYHSPSQLARQQSTQGQIRIQGIQRVLDRVPESYANGVRIIYPGNETDRNDLSGNQINSPSSNSRYMTLSGNQSISNVNVTRIISTNTKNVVYQTSINSNNV